MAATSTSRFVTLLQRELREYRNSLFWTPIIAAVLLGVLMLGSVLLANRISVVGQTILDTLIADHDSGVNISVSMDNGVPITVIEMDRDDPDYAGQEDMEIEIRARDESGQETRSITRVEFDGGEPAPPPAPAAGNYRVVVEPESDVEQWNFSREWTFNPVSRDRAAGGDLDGVHRDMDGRQLNVILTVVHGILLLILLLTSVNYLLDALYVDRKDHSILFWRSMPVGEWEVVLAKFATAMVVAPLIYIAISLLLQLSYVLLMMLLVWRMDEDPFEVVVQNIDFAALMIDPISGWLMTALLIAPTYAWLLCASALAKRSPFLMAITPVIGLFIAERIFLGTEFWGDAVQNHLPHVTESSAVGFYLFGPSWMGLDLLSVGGGLLFAAGALVVAVWLRRHRWELN